MELIFGFTATEDANNQPATVINVSIRLEETLIFYSEDELCVLHFFPLCCTFFAHVNLLTFVSSTPCTKSATTTTNFAHFMFESKMCPVRDDDIL